MVTLTGIDFKLTTSATQIAASGKELEATVAEQVASTNEVSATATEIAANSRELVRTVEQVAGMTEQSLIIKISFFGVKRKCVNRPFDIHHR